MEVRRVRREPILALRDLQGNILPGFRKDRQHFVFFRIEDASAARRWLASLADRISSGDEVLHAHRTWKASRMRLGREPDNAHFLFLNLALSAGGLAKLLTTAELDEFDDDAFKVGLAARSVYIGDPKTEGDPGHAASWKFGGPGKPVDLLAILASDDRPWVEEETASLVTAGDQHGLAHVHTDVGDVARSPSPGHEQFGFRDGISELAIRGRHPEPPHEFVVPRSIPKGKGFEEVRKQFATPSKRLVWPGNVLFGYPRQDPNDPTQGVATDFPAGPKWAANGSYLVYRRLRQDVEGFRRFLAETAASLQQSLGPDAPQPDKLAAMLVGRWPSGTPFIRSPGADAKIAGEAANYFGFDGPLGPPLPGDPAPPGAPDPNGRIVPLASHIRKSNPRDLGTDIGPATRTPPRLLVRRGITYADGEGPDADRGLLFVAYQSSIQNQFEFLMRTWINNPDRPEPQAGHDPILVQRPGGTALLRLAGTELRIPLPGGLVIPTGGEYFFAPSVSFFERRLRG
ncbi:MAG: Dyp-type peroxidase [Planctomycetes bacterium]|nr:Dyp-type peroxidase [Planctomycetota bacterium]